MNKIELLSPVGDFECLKAAVQSGADCVYFGSGLLNARTSANNFNNEELKSAIEYAKLRNVKTNLALNILIKNNEFNEAIQLTKTAYEYGIDAIIVQDLGLATKLIELFPDLPIHASTQMTVHNLEGVLQAEKMGFKRVVLSRELSIDEIKYICENSNIEIEVFIHGALCISYSGQCLLSSMIGARSGNRGKCAQPCRLPYKLLKHDKKNDKQYQLEKGYLLSTKDLCSLDLLPTLVNLGIKCFKIEGRLKNSEYVSTVTKIYRKYIDLAQSNSEYVVDENDRKTLLQAFNRGGFSTGYLENTPNSNLIYKDKPNNMGIFLGTIHNYNPSKGYITIKLNESISIGDTIAIHNQKGSYKISELMINNNNVPTAYANNIVKIGRIKGNISIGEKIYKINSKETTILHNDLISSENKKNKINCNIIIKKNTSIKMEISTDENHPNELLRNINFSLTSDLIPVDSINSPISKDRIITQINKLGGTIYEFENINVDLDENLYIPSISKLNQLRRDCIEHLEKILLSRISRKSLPNNIYIDAISSNINTFSSTDVFNCTTENDTNINSTNPKTSILLNNLNINYDYNLLQDIDRLYIPLRFFYNKNYFNILNILTKKFNTYIYMPSIIKQTQNINLDNIINSFNIKGFVLSNLSNIIMLNKFKNNYEFIANYTMNIYNNLTINELSKHSISCVTISPELDKNTINSIQSNINKETIVYGNLPVMTTNYCLLSKHNNCLQTCTNNCNNSSISYYLQDRMNLDFKLMQDSFFKTTTIFNSKKLSYSYKNLHTNYIRLDFIDEKVEEINEIIKDFKNDTIPEGSDFTNGNYNRILEQ